MSVFEVLSLLMLVAIWAGVVLLHIRLSGIARRVTNMERTGVLIEDVRAAKLKEVRPANPRQKLRFIERTINRGVNVEH